jgi:preprotein translocase subunit SecD
MALTFRVVPPDGSTPSKPQVNAVGDVMSARLDAYREAVSGQRNVNGLGSYSMAAQDGRLAFEIEWPVDAASEATFRSLLGTTGIFTVGQPVATPPAIGQQVTGAPLLTAQAIESAALGTDQLGNPTLDLTLTPEAATAFGGATSAHVGDYLPVALDGKAVTVPVIMSAITDGRLQLSFDAAETSAAWLAALLQSGPLPLPVEDITP